MTTGANMADDKRLDIPPGVKATVRQEVRAAIQDALTGISLVDLAACQEELKATRYALLDMQQKFEVWHELAIMHGEQVERRAAQICELEKRLIGKSTEIAMLRSALDNNNNAKQ